MTANPDFLEFFAGQWQQELNAVQIPGMPGASWDRKAAWLYWRTLTMPVEELFMDSGCSVCNGDCAAANPPVWNCPKLAASAAPSLPVKEWREVFAQPKMPWEK